jgi:hypothetical protein
MDRVAELTKKTRDETFIERLADGKQVNCTTSIFSLGGATLDNEWNHIQQKLMRGLGIVPSRTRPEYDTAPASPVWGHGSVAARPPCTRERWRTRLRASSWAPTWRRTTRSRSAGP